MKKKTRKMELLTMAAAVVLVGNTVLYVSAEPVTVVNSEAKTAEQETKVCKLEEHVWSEWTVVKEADCVTEGLEKRTCGECNAEETKSIAINDKHELKETGREAASASTPEMILYECQREGCNHQEKKTADLIENEIPELTPTPEPTLTPTPELTPEPTQIPEPSLTPIPEATPEPTPGTAPEEELPEIDPDTIDSSTSELPEFDMDEEYLTFSSCTSTEIVTEYDPETAVSTIQVAKDPEKPEETEEVEGMTVPGGTTEIQRDKAGNVTDLTVSAAISEIRNGFSLNSTAETLHSITLIHKDVPTMDWITFTAKNPASELGIQLQYTDDEILFSLTENQQLVQIVKVENEADSIVLTTSTGSICRINQKVRQIIVEDRTFSSKINQVTVSLNDDGILEAEFDYVKDNEKPEEMLYWIVPFEDVDSEPIVITIYK